MKNQNQSKYLFLLSSIALISSFILNGCTTSRISGSVTENAKPSVYANPELIQFSSEHYALMYKQTSLKLGYSLPITATYNAIKNAADKDEAKKLYNNAMEDMVNSGQLKEALLDFFIEILGVGNKATDAAGIKSREAANIGVFTVLKNLPMSNFFQAQTTYTDAGAETPQTYSNGYPVNEQAGFITTQTWLENWANQFMFKPVREAYAIAFCDTAPFARTDLYRWKDTELNPKYLQATNNGTLFCEGCHEVLNVGRGGFLGYNGTTKTYNGTNTQGTDQYTHEQSNATGATLEPLSNGSPIAEATAEANKYKLTDNGSSFNNPKQWAAAIVKHERFAPCQTERLITFALGLDPGKPGTPPTAPNYFSGNEAGKAFVEKWTAKFNDLNQKPKDFLIAFFQSADFLVTGYIDPNETGATP